MSGSCAAALALAATSFIDVSSLAPSGLDAPIPSRRVVEVTTHHPVGSAYVGVAAARRQDVDVSGIWNFDVETSAGSGTPTMTFKQEGTQLTGTYEGQLGKAPLKGTVDGKKIEFTFTVDVQGQSVEIGYQGTIESATTMKGTVGMAGGAITGSFTAKKKAA